ncbi:hypothetical protein HOF92_01800 [bacterium]|jgi:hypothetical protein|nr:hypothetical protein [bacterium]
MKQEFDGQVFQIAQPEGSCCESGCDGCELFIYKKKNSLPLKNPRGQFYRRMLEKQSPKKK